MSKSVFQKSFISFIALLFFLSSASFVFSKAEEEHINYVALGDSLAAGLTSDKTIDSGYTGILANYFEEYSQLNSYTNAFAVPGYTSENLLQDILTNKEMEGVHIQDIIKMANVITITVGANDLIKEATIDWEVGTVTLKEEDVVHVLTNLGENMANILSEITLLNEKVEVYISGYYNPFPYLAKEQQEQLLPILEMLNQVIEETTIAFGATFVPLKSIFDEDLAQYLPIPTDIHPSMEGYHRIATSFINAWEHYQVSKLIKLPDVSKDDEGYEEMKLAVKLGLLHVTATGDFDPNESISRAEVAQAIMNAIPFDLSMPPNPNFADVSENHDAYYAIAKLTEAGVFVKAEAFYPDAPITRAQAAKVLTYIFQLESNGENTFTDISSSYWAQSYIEALAANNITSGYHDNTFRPGQEMSRSDFAIFLVRCLKHIGDL